MRVTQNKHLLLTTNSRDVGPADIDVVAGIGDYLVAGTAALANTTGDTFKNFPEVSFAMGKKKCSHSVRFYTQSFTGGVGDWRTSTTIPNILRQFNPNLIGFSVGTVQIYLCTVSVIKIQVNNFR